MARSQCRDWWISHLETLIPKTQKNNVDKKRQGSTPIVVICFVFHCIFFCDGVILSRAGNLHRHRFFLYFDNCTRRKIQADNDEKFERVSVHYLANFTCTFLMMMCSYVEVQWNCWIINKVERCLILNKNPRAHSLLSFWKFLQMDFPEVLFGYRVSKRVGVNSLEIT